MFDDLSERLSKTLRNLTGKGTLSEDNIREALRDIRRALLDADVALSVVVEFIKTVEDQIIGKEVPKDLQPDQFVIKLVNEQLIKTLGETQAELSFKAKPPVVILMAGLQGSGKTTSTAKLAKWLKEQQKKKVLVVSCDVYRPAAIEQLKSVAEQVEVDCFPSSPEQQPQQIAEQAFQHAKQQFYDVLIVDTAGRLHIDDEMMTEIKQLHQCLQPTETLFVADSMLGQDVANSAKAFHDALALTGVILTKLDGDARGGAALSIRNICGKPIKFIGVGEKMDALEPFYPDRLASRILGMGDILSLIEEIEQKVDKKKADKLAKKLKKGQGFDLEDFRGQLLLMNDMGGMTSLLDKMPGMGGMAKAAKGQLDDKVTHRMIAIINSMTPKERAHPALIKSSGSRKKRIAMGAGVELQDINRLLKQHLQMQKMFKKFSSKGGIKRMMRGLQGKLPAGMMPPGDFH